MSKQQEKAELTKTEELKRIQAEKKAIRDKEKALKSQMDATLEQRKKARHRVARNKAEILEKRKMVTDATRIVNRVMLTKSIKNNMDEFKEALDKFYKASSEFITASNLYVESVEELSKYE